MTISVEVLDDLDRIDPEVWSELVEAQNRDTSIFLTREWQRCWWESFGRGRLLPILVSRAGRHCLLAPLFVDGEMAFLVGSGGSDYLDLVGDSSDPETVQAVLGAAFDAVPDLLGVRLYHVPEWSPTGIALREAVEKTAWKAIEEESLPAPFIRVGADGDALRAAAGKKSLVRHERWFGRNGDLRLIHSAETDDVLSHLDEFFDQHVDRWRNAGVESQFTDGNQRRFFRSLAVHGSETGWLRFTRVVWDERTIAAHLGFSYRGSFLWYKPTFDVSLAKRSPGEVLLRSLLLAAADEGVHTFDFGLGDEAFKNRFTDQVRTVRTWGVYPSGTAVRVGR